MRIEVSGRQFNFPPHCACCGTHANTAVRAAASKTSGKKVVKTQTNYWDFPYCSSCISHVKAANNATNMAKFLGIGSVVFAAFLYLGVASWLGILVFIGGIAGTAVLYNNMMTQAKALCVSQCACITEAVGFLGWDGTCQAFEITSPQYALAFMLANDKKLINLSPAAKNLLESSGHGHRANRPQRGGQQRS